MKTISEIGNYYLNEEKAKLKKIRIRRRKNKD